MSSEMLSRRRLFTAGTALAAAASVAALPAVAEATNRPALPPTAPVQTAPELTPIAKLWQQAETVQAEDDAACREYDRLLEEVDRRAGPPPVAITYGEESEALGISGIAAPVDRYIWPRYIEDAMRHAHYTKQLALQKRLKQMLRISLRYDAKLGALRRELGVDAVNDRTEALTGRAVRLEYCILDMPSVTVNDLEIKLKIQQLFDGCEPNHATESILCDMRRLMKRPEDLARLLSVA
jgi:hypothetical protein